MDIVQQLWAASLVFLHEEHAPHSLERRHDARVICLGPFNYFLPMVGNAKTVLDDFHDAHLAKDYVSGISDSPVVSCQAPHFPSHHTVRRRRLVQLRLSFLFSDLMFFNNSQAMNCVNRQTIPGPCSLLQKRRQVYHAVTQTRQRLFIRIGSKCLVFYGACVEE